MGRVIWIKKGGVIRSNIISIYHICAYHNELTAGPKSTKQILMAHRKWKQSHDNAVKGDETKTVQSSASHVCPCLDDSSLIPPLMGACFTVPAFTFDLSAFTPCRALQKLPVRDGTARRGHYTRGWQRSTVKAARAWYNVALCRTGRPCSQEDVVATCSHKRNAKIKLKPNTKKGRRKVRYERSLSLRRTLTNQSSCVPEISTPSCTDQEKSVPLERFISVENGNRRWKPRMRAAGPNSATKFEFLGLASPDAPTSQEFPKGAYRQCQPASFTGAPAKLSTDFTEENRGCALQ